MAGAVWPRLYAWKGPALIILGNGNKWLESENRSGKERVCDTDPESSLGDTGNWGFQHWKRTKVNVRLTKTMTRYSANRTWSSP